MRLGSFCKAFYFGWDRQEKNKVRDRSHFPYCLFGLFGLQRTIGLGHMAPNRKDDDVQPRILLISRQHPVVSKPFPLIDLRDT